MVSPDDGSVIKDETFSSDILLKKTSFTNVRDLCRMSQKKYYFVENMARCHTHCRCPFVCSVSFLTSQGTGKYGIAQPILVNCCITKASVKFTCGCYFKQCLEHTFNGTQQLLRYLEICKERDSFGALHLALNAGTCGDFFRLGWKVSQTIPYSVIVLYLLRNSVVLLGQGQICLKASQICRTT